MPGDGAPAAAAQRKPDGREHVESEPMRSAIQPIRDGRRRPRRAAAPRRRPAAAGVRSPLRGGARRRRRRSRAGWPRTGTRSRRAPAATGSPTAGAAPAADDRGAARRGGRRQDPDGAGKPRSARSRGAEGDQREPPVRDAGKQRQGERGGDAAERTPVCFTENTRLRRLAGVTRPRRSDDAGCSVPCPIPMMRIRARWPRQRRAAWRRGRRRGSRARSPRRVPRRNGR